MNIQSFSSTKKPQREMRMTSEWKRRNAFTLQELEKQAFVDITAMGLAAVANKHGVTRQCIGARIRRYEAQIGKQLIMPYNYSLTWFGRQHLKEIERCVTTKI